MKVKLLPTTFDQNGCASARQHLCCFVIDDRVAVDAGSLAMATTDEQKQSIRDVVLTHAHLDHIAGLPLFIDDLFATLEKPVCVYATREVIEILERDIFNWDIYPRFSELQNKHGEVLQYEIFDCEKEFAAAHLKIKAVRVNHKVPTVGFVISDGTTKIAISGDTAEMDDFWQSVNAEEKLDALLIECAFPNDLQELACASHHLTPRNLKLELEKFVHRGECPVYVVNLKPMYCEKVVAELKEMRIENLHILRVGQVYQW
jgi:ribonuclease BN (tRNA processing enzyme)